MNIPKGQAVPPPHQVHSLEERTDGKREGTEREMGGEQQQEDSPCAVLEDCVLEQEL